MNIHAQSDIWIHRSMIALSLIIAVGAGVALILVALDQPLPEILIALGAVAKGGLARLLMSRRLFERNIRK